MTWKMGGKVAFATCLDCFPSRLKAKSERKEIKALILAGLRGLKLQLGTCCDAGTPGLWRGPFPTAAPKKAPCRLEGRRADVEQLCTRRHGETVLSFPAQTSQTQKPCRHPQPRGAGERERATWFSDQLRQWQERTVAPRAGRVSTLSGQLMRQRQHGNLCWTQSTGIPPTELASVAGTCQP